MCSPALPRCPALVNVCVCVNFIFVNLSAFGIVSVCVCVSVCGFINKAAALLDVGISFFSLLTHLTDQLFAHVTVKKRTTTAASAIIIIIITTTVAVKLMQEQNSWMEKKKQ